MAVDIKTGDYDAPAIGERIVEFLNNGSNPPIAIVENGSPAVGGATASVRFQESDNGSDWTDIADTVASIPPGGKNVVRSLVSQRARLALYASGNVPLLVTVIRTVDGSPENLGAA